MANRLSAWGRTGSGFHGSLRGADAPRRSDTFEGRFGRMFRTLPAANYSTEHLMALGEAMKAEPEIMRKDDLPKGEALRDPQGRMIPKATKEQEPGKPKVDPDDEENYGIPAGYTYLGQFIDHDITFDPMSSLMQQNDPEALIDFRTPRLDLDNLHGRGPADQPYMYVQDKMFRLSERALTRGPVASKALDLQRLGDRAVIGDKRNDENVIVSQLQGVFLNFHNAVVKDMLAAEFETVQRSVRWHYQWIVLHDFLPRMVGQKMVDAILPHLSAKNGNLQDQPPNLNYFKWRNEPFMPIEFAAAAYRFGHSMVRPIYRLSQELTGPSIDPDLGFDTGVSGRKFIFAALRNRGLNGFESFPPDWGIDWSLFFELGHKLDPARLGPDRVQPSYKIDTSLVNPLAFLPEFSQKRPGRSNDLVADKDGFPVPMSGHISNLATRNLLRGHDMRLPSGQAVARYMGLEPIPDAELKVGKAIMGDFAKNPSILEFGKGSPGAPNGFSDNAPLWFYVLAEAQDAWAKAAGKTAGNDIAKNAIPVTLGPVGGRIVAEVLIGLLVGDSTSFLRQDPTWKPKYSTNGKFGMPELIRKSGLA